MTIFLVLPWFRIRYEKGNVAEPVVCSVAFFDHWKEERWLWREIMSIVQKMMSCVTFKNILIKGHPHISNIILPEPLDFLDLAELKPHNNQTIITRKRGPTITPWTFQLTQTTQLKKWKKINNKDNYILITNSHTQQITSLTYINHMLYETTGK